MSKTISVSPAHIVNQGSFFSMKPTQNKITPPKTEKIKLEEMLHSSLSAALEGLVAVAVEDDVDVGEEPEGEVDDDDDGEVADEAPAELLKTFGRYVRFEIFE